MADETFTYKADFSQIKDEVDATSAKVDKLRESLERTAKKFGDASPQATMVKTALDRVMADLDKKIAALEKLVQQQAKSGNGPSFTGTGGAKSGADEDLERRYKRESLKYYREYQQKRRHEEAHGKEFENLFKGLAGKGGIFNPQAISSFINLITGGAGRGGGGSLGSMAANVGGGMLGARVLKGGAGVAGAATAAEEASAAAGAAGTTEAMTIGVTANLLKRPGIITAIASAAVAADFVIASRGAARGKFAAGIGGTVGGAAAADLGYDRYLDDTRGVMRSMMEGRFDITSPQYRALTLLGINPRGKKPEDLIGQSTSAVSKQLKGFGKVDEDTLLTLAHVTGMGNLGYSDEDLIRLYQGGQKDIDAVAKKAKGDRSKYDLSPDQVKALQDNVQWMKEWATEGETLVEKGIAVGTQFTELANKSMPDLIKVLDNMVKEYDILSPLLNSVNKEFQNLGKQLHDWVAKNLSTAADAAEVAPDVGAGAGGGGGSPGTGAPPSIRNRGRTSGAPGGGGGPADTRPSTTYTGPPGEGWENTWGSASGSRQAGSTEGWGLQPGFKEKIDKMLAAGAAAGYPASINEGFRSFAYQAFLYKKLHGIGPVAAPGGSWHEKGMAVDLTTKNLDWYIKHASEFGIYPGALFPGNPDPGHFQDHSGRAADWPAYTPHWVPKPGEPPTKPVERVSMNNMDSFQRNNKPYAISIHNPAGASYQVAGGMLGGSLGNYGNS